MAKAGRRPPDLHVFDGAEHYFMRLSPNSQAARRAWAEIERFLDAELKSASRQVMGLSRWITCARLPAGS
jgi:hypothetical protein